MRQSNKWRLQQDTCVLLEVHVSWIVISYTSIIFFCQRQWRWLDTKIATVNFLHTGYAVNIKKQLQDGYYDGDYDGDDDDDAMVTRQPGWWHSCHSSHWWCHPSCSIADVACILIVWVWMELWLSVMLIVCSLACSVLCCLLCRHCNLYYMITCVH